MHGDVQHWSQDRRHANQHEEDEVGKYTLSKYLDPRLHIVLHVHVYGMFDTVTFKFRIYVNMVPFCYKKGQCSISHFCSGSNYGQNITVLAWCLRMGREPCHQCRIQVT